jgi:hypothetical protein
VSVGTTSHSFTGILFPREAEIYNYTLISVVLIRLRYSYSYVLMDVRYILLGDKHPRLKNIRVSVSEQGSLIRMLYPPMV